MSFVKLTDNGDVAVNGDGTIALETDELAPVQFAKSECRCEQGQWFANNLFGRNPLYWKFSQSVTDRIQDITRICSQYRTVRTIYFQDEVFTIEL